jgi:hypothetical protein
MVAALTHFNLGLVVALDFLAAKVGQANCGIQGRAETLKIRVLGGGSTAASSAP